jgi:hypothetical protein
MMAPRRPVLKNFCQATETPESLFASIDIDIQRSDASNEEHARYDTELTSNHEAKKVSPLNRARRSSWHRVSSFRRGNLGNSKEGNLHTFKKTDNAHEDEENNDSSPLRNTFPHGGLALEQTSQSQKAEDGERSKAADQKKKLWLQCVVPRIQLSTGKPPRASG